MKRKKKKSKDEIIQSFFNYTAAISGAKKAKLENWESYVIPHDLLAILGLSGRIEELTTRLDLATDVIKPHILEAERNGQPLC